MSTVRTHRVEMTMSTAHLSMTTKENVLIYMSTVTTHMIGNDHEYYRMAAAMFY